MTPACPGQVNGALHKVDAVGAPAAQQQIAHDRARAAAQIQRGARRPLRQDVPDLGRRYAAVPGHVALGVALCEVLEAVFGHIVGS